MAAPKLHGWGTLIPTIILTLFWGTWMIILAALQFLRAPRQFLTSTTYTKIPDIALNAELGQHGFVTVEAPVHDGTTKLKIHYVANGPADKPLMLLLHGYPECWYSWRFQLREFSKNYRVVAIDQRGYGDSGKPSGIANYCLDFLVEDVRLFVQAFGYKKCILVGHDWGGAVTWATATKYPEMCERVIVMNCPHLAAFQKFVRSSWRQILASWYMFYFQLPFLPEIMMKSNDFKFLALVFRGKKAGLQNRENFTAEDLDVFKYYFSSYEGRNGPLNWYRASMRYIPNLPKTKIKPPTLLVWGTGDQALTLPMAAASGKFVEDFTLKYVEGASHWVQQDDPGVVNQHVHSFLE